MIPVQTEPLLECGLSTGACDFVGGGCLFAGGKRLSIVLFVLACSVLDLEDNPGDKDTF